MISHSTSSRLIFFPDDSDSEQQDTFRIGGHYAPTPNSDFIFSGVYTNIDGETTSIRGAPVPDSRIQGEKDGLQGEAQYIFRHDWFNATVGGGRYEIETDEMIHLGFPFLPVPCPLPSCDTTDSFSADHSNAYLYTNVQWPRDVTWTFGMSYDSVNGPRDMEKINPKLGTQWDITDWARLRLAYFQTVKREQAVDATIEPTQVAGFNQFFDDSNATETERYGVGLDTIFTENLYGGVEYSRRDLKEQNFLLVDGMPQPVLLGRREDLIRTYLYWTPHPHVAVNAAAEYEQFKRPANDPSVMFGEALPEVDTVSIPLGIRYFHPFGYFASLSGTYVRQEVDLAPAEIGARNSDNFFLVDASMGYRLPKRLGIISLEARNLFDQTFFYQDLRTNTASGVIAPPYIPDRTVMLRATFALDLISSAPFFR